MENWTDIASEDGNVSCPISFEEDEVSESMRLHGKQVEADEQLQVCREGVGVGSEGWVPMEMYDEAKERERNLKTDAIEAAESEEGREKLIDHWIFGDEDEGEYE